MFFTNQPEVAAQAVAAGVDRIFLDLERLGKLERQGHLDTRISQHTFEDLRAIRVALPRAFVLVRINPVNPGPPREVEEAVAAGADLIMLPMFRTRGEVAQVLACIRGRVPLSLLVETRQAAEGLEEILAEPGLGEVHIGLNDLHLELGLDFMFEPLASGMVDRLVACIKRRGLPFGFGGICRMGEGPFPGDCVLAEQVRLGSSFVILARSFSQRGQDLAGGITALREREAALRRCSGAELEAMHADHAERIVRIARERALTQGKAGHEAAR